MAVRLCIALMACLFLVAAPAWAEPTFEVSVTPEAVSFPETRELTYRVTIRTTEPETFWMVASGAGLVSPVSAVLEGPGMLTFSPPPSPAASSLRLSPPPPPCGDAMGFRTSYHDPVRGLGYGLDLPANAVSTVVMTATLSKDAPRPVRPDAPPRPGIPETANAAGENYWVGLEADNRFGGTLDQPYVEIPTPVVPAGGRMGTWITLDLDLPARSCIPENRGTPVTLTGTTYPPLAGEDITLMVAHRPTIDQVVAPAKDLVTVKTAADGTFALVGWRPQETGRYGLQAQYRSTRPDLADDFSPPVTFDLRAPVPLPTEPARLVPRPELAVLTSPTVSVRGRSARVRLRCPRTDGCRGIVRLKARRVITDWRSFRIAAGKERTVTVRVGPSIRRALRAGRLDGEAHVRLNDFFSRTPVKLRALR